MYGHDTRLGENECLRTTLGLSLNVHYCPRYHPIPYRSKKLVIIVNELA